MRKQTCISHSLFRVQIKLFSPLIMGIFFSFCLLVVYTVYQLAKMGDPKMLSVTTCLLYLFTQSSNYYLLFAPAIIAMLIGLIDMGSVETLISIRCSTKSEYHLSKLCSIFFFILICTLCAILTAAVIYSFSTNPNIDWHFQHEYLNRFGIVLIQPGLLMLSEGGVIAVQSIILMCSFFFYGLLLSILHNVLCKKFAVITISLSLNAFLLLGTKLDLPEWLFKMLPYRYLFLTYFESAEYLIIVLIYWLIWFMLLCFLYYMSIKKYNRIF